MGNWGQEIEVELTRPEGKPLPGHKVTQLTLSDACILVVKIHEDMTYEHFTRFAEEGVRKIKEKLGDRWPIFFAGPGTDVYAVYLGSIKPKGWLRRLLWSWLWQ